MTELEYRNMRLKGSYGQVNVFLRFSTVREMRQRFFVKDAFSCLHDEIDMIARIL